MTRALRAALHSLVVLAVLLGATARAQEAEVRCEGPAAECEPEGEARATEVYRPTSSGPFITFTAPLPGPGQLTAQPILSAGLSRGAYDAAGRFQPLGTGEDRGGAGLSLFLEAGVWERLSLGGQLTVLHQWRSEPPTRATATGLGDVQVFARGMVLAETPALLPEVTVLGLVKLNTGNASSQKADLLGTDVRGSGSVDLTLGVDLTKGVRPLLLHLDLLYTRALPAVVDGEPVRYGDTFSWSTSAEWPFLPEVLGLMVEVSGRHQGPPTVGGVRDPTGRLDEVVVGGGLEVLFSRRAQLLVGYQRTLWGRNTPALDTLIVTLVPTLF